MSRIEKKRIKRIERYNKIKTTLSLVILLVFLMLFLYTGLTAVNINNRSMLMLEDIELFSLTTIEEKEYKISFLGNSYFFESDKINSFIEKTKAVSIDNIDKLKSIINKKSIFAKD